MSKTIEAPVVSKNETKKKQNPPAKPNMGGWKKIITLLAIIGLICLVPYLPIFDEELSPEQKIARVIKDEILTNPNLVGNTMLPLHKIWEALSANDIQSLSDLKVFIKSLKDGDVKKRLLAAFCEFSTDDELCGASKTIEEVVEKIVLSHEEQFLNLTLKELCDKENVTYKDYNYLYKVIRFETRTIKEYLELVQENPILLKSSNYGKKAIHRFLNTIKRYAPERFSLLKESLEASKRIKPFIPEQYPIMNEDYIKLKDFE